MNETAAGALYYTFSTIAQSLAGAIALWSAFVLFRMQTIHGEIERRSDELLNVVSDSKAADAHARGDFATVFDISSVQITTPSKSVDYARRRLRALLAHERSLKRWLWTALVLTIGLITGAVVVLSRTPWIVGIDRAPAIVLDAGIGWFLACLASYLMLLLRALASSHGHER